MLTSYGLSSPHSCEILIIVLENVFNLYSFTYGDLRLYNMHFLSHNKVTLAKRNYYPQQA